MIDVFTDKYQKPLAVAV